MADLLLYIDEDACEHAVVQALRVRNIDLLTTIEANRLGNDDHSQLAFAASTGRAIYTFNVGDFAKLHYDYLTENKTHAGIIVIPDQRSSIGEKVRRLASFISRTNAEEMVNRMEYL
ncbi:hypothetical protein MNBD_CHLOROFLEXI01-4783 [hydrothermal vent metagenome]|uniref:DUF5615 domain-containing protein n=1 Tax=hydrothermal vent metagenome TaxID=652676 RepID=A0A3B0UIK3_9ZZZZ